MKFLSVIILVLVCNTATAQIKEINTIYHWEDLPEVYDADTIYALSFSKMRLEQLPEGLDKFKHVSLLDLSKNKLTDLPDVIKEFQNLTILNLEKNKFEQLPLEVCHLKNLIDLNASRNFMSTLPISIEYLTALSKLDLYDNPIRTLPDSFERMQNLEKVDLSGIRFSPDFQEQWQARLPNVEFLFDEACDCMK